MAETSARFVVPALLAAGLLARLGMASWSFLNPDEALHFLLSEQPSLRLAYQASLTTAHPPFLILLLYYWRWLGRSELVLRLPSVLAGTAFCWVMFLWLRRVRDKTTALIGLTLFLFAPSLILLSAEIRQYSLLLFFAAGALYFLDRALLENSFCFMVLSGLALDFALLTHYSALIFALTIGIYALLRLRAARVRPAVIACWIGGQCCALAVVTFLFKTHIRLLRSEGLPQEISDTWLRTSIFHSGREHGAVFAVRNTIRLFHYFFSQGAIGVLALLLFVVGTGWLVWRERGETANDDRPSSRQLGFLLLFPFAVNCGLALTGIYPYGGTRHNAMLEIFATPGISIGLACWKSSPAWLKPAGIAAALLFCNLFPNPTGAYIRPRDQHKPLMTNAVDFLRDSAPPSSIVVADNGGGLLLSYYLCHRNVVQFQPPYQPFQESHCGNYSVITSAPVFSARVDTAALQSIGQYYALTPGTPVWIFEAGWIVDKEHDPAAELRQAGCPDPRMFGRNVVMCRTAIP